jgi:transaldolase
LSTKIFCDIAELRQIKRFNKKKIVKGFTTNPSLMRKAGANNYQNYCKKILKATKKPVSFEVFSDDTQSMIRQGLIISQWSKNLFVKVPVVNSKGVFTGKVISYLNSKNIKLNITAIYSFRQTAQILKQINKKTKVILSIFAGRMSDKGIDPIPEIKKSIKLAKKFKNVEILWASTREAYNYLQAKKLRCHLITIPPNMIEVIENFGSSKKELSIKTVKAFLSDSKKSKFKL